jgi:hypothetical protein
LHVGAPGRIILPFSAVLIVMLTRGVVPVEIIDTWAPGTGSALESNTYTESVPPVVSIPRGCVINRVLMTQDFQEISIDTRL